MNHDVFVDDVAQVLYGCDSFFVFLEISIKFSFVDDSVVVFVELRDFWVSDGVEHGSINEESVFQGSIVDHVVFVSPRPVVWKSVKELEVSCGDAEYAMQRKTVAVIMADDASLRQIGGDEAFISRICVDVVEAQGNVVVVGGIHVLDHQKPDVFHRAPIKVGRLSGG